MLIDAFQPGLYDRAAFEGLHAAAVTAVSVNCGYWEGTTASLDNLAAWRDLLRDNADLAVLARSVADIEAAEREGKVALLLGYQNIACLQGRIRFVELFAELGIRILQITYNNQTEAGSSCYEAGDGGLTRFGRELVTELNRCGVLLDLSHVGEKTALEALERSSAPVAITHSNAASLYAHKRNKSDTLLKALAAKGGVLGCAIYPSLVGERWSASLPAWCTMVARTAEIMGVAHVAVGTGRRYKGTPEQLDWARMGLWTRHKDFGAGGPSQAVEPMPAWCRTLEDLGKIEAGLAQTGFAPAEVRMILRDNWMRLFRQTLQ